MKNLPLICCLVGLLPLALRAQSDAPTLPRLTLKLNGTALCNPVIFSVLGSSDIRLTPRMAANIGIGRFLNYHTSLAEGSKTEPYEGWRLKGGLNWQIRYRSNARRTTLFGFELKYNHILHQYLALFDMQGEQYQQQTIVRRRVRTAGVAARLAWQRYLGARRRGVLEIFTGMGLQNTVVDEKTPTLGHGATFAARVQSDSWSYDNGDNFRLDALFGIQIGWVLW